MSAIHKASSFSRAQNPAGMDANATQPAFAFSINTANNNVGGLSGSAPVASFIDTSNNSTFMGALGNYNSTSAIATNNVGTDQWQAILSSATNSIQSVIASMANLAKSVTGEIYNVFTAPHQLSLTINQSDPTKDAWGSYTGCPTGKTLLVVHGMNDYIEQGFSTGTNESPQIIQPIVAAGGYQSVIGFDYDWTQAINTSGSQLATFLDTVTQSQCSGVALDIEAHSEGVAVGLSALTQMDVNQRSVIKHLIALGGPIMGTPMANDSRWVGTILMAMSALDIGNNVVLDSLADLLTKPFVFDLQVSTPGSNDVLDKIRSSLSTASNQPLILAVAGNKAQAGTGVLGRALRVCGALLQEWGATYSDGFIPVTSALALQPGVNKSAILKVYPLKPFSTDHIDLIQCGDGAGNDPCSGIANVVNSVKAEVTSAFVPPLLNLSNLSDCSDSSMCTGSPGTVFLLSGNGSYFRHEPRV